jgi:hypothetical protein
MIMLLLLMVVCQFLKSIKHQKLIFNYNKLIKNYSSTIFRGSNLFVKMDGRLLTLIEALL